MLYEVITDGGLFDVGALERLNMEVKGFVDAHPAFLIHGQGAGGDFQQRIAAGVETAGFNVDDHGIIAPEAGLEGMGGQGLSHVIPAAK